jgi:organic radical activating enzyme
MKEFIKVGSQAFIKNKLASCTWIINRYCNYSCSYCWPHAHQQQKDFLPEDTYLVAVNEVIQQFQNNGYNALWWSFSGGEVTFNPSYLPILEEIQQYNTMLMNLTTNLSQSMKWWEKFYNCTKNFYSVKVNGSWHGEYLKDENKNKLFRDKLIMLRDNGIKVACNIVVNPGELEQTKRLLDFFNEKEIYVLLKGNRSHYNFIDGYSKEEFNLIKNQGIIQKKYLQQRKDYITVTLEDNTELKFNSYEELMAYQNRDYYGWKCKSGHQAITIYENGDVCRGRICRNEKLGSIKTGFRLHREIKKCITKNPCACSGDLKMLKWKML